MRPAGSVTFALLALPLAGCASFLAGEPLDACQPGVLADGHLVPVRVVWNATGEPVEGACVHASPARAPEPASEQRTGADGEVTLRLPDGDWRLSALRGRPPGGHCAYVVFADLRVAGPPPGPSVLRLVEDAVMCV